MLEKGSRKKEHFLFNLFLQSIFISLILVTFAYPPLYLEACRLHFLSGVLPICARVDGKWRHAEWVSPLLRISLLFLQFLITTELVCAVLLNIAAILIIVFASQQMSQEMRYDQMYALHFSSVRPYLR